MTNFKALLLLPAASAGALTAMTVQYPSRDLAELGLMLVIIMPLYLVNLFILGWSWTRPPGGRFLGLTRVTWSVLVAVAFLLGLSLMFIA